MPMSFNACVEWLRVTAREMLSIEGDDDVVVDTYDWRDTANTLLGIADSLAASASTLPTCPPPPASTPTMPT